MGNVKQVSAADNLVVAFNSTAWQLRNGKNAPMLHADADGLRYNAQFASSRRLSSTGLLTNGDILQVVLGWQRSDETWHLGVVLSPDLAAVRGSRWCELVHWPDPEQVVFEELAQETGRNLAAALHVPFRFIPPKPVEAPLPLPSLPALPLRAGLWSFQPVESDKQKYGFAARDGQFVIQRAALWKRQRYTRILWYTLWVIIYAALSTATLTSDLALPNAGTLLPDPHWLPYLGLLTAAGLILLIFYQLYQIRSQPDTILIDPAEKSVSAWAGKDLRWSMSVQEVQSVYVSEVVKRKAEDISSEHGELNLHLGTGKFHFVFQQGEPENQALRYDAPEKPARQTDIVRQLTRYSVTSDLQAMGLYMAEALGLPCWYDMRVR